MLKRLICLLLGHKWFLCAFEYVTVWVTQMHPCSDWLEARTYRGRICTRCWDTHARQVDEPRHIGHLMDYDFSWESDPNYDIKEYR